MDVLNLHNIRMGVDARNKAEIFAIIADLALQGGYAADRNGVIAGLEDRESKGSTGMEGGFAIPHVLGDAVSRAGVIILRLANPVPVSEWETFDDQPVNYVIALVAPANAAGNEHLKLLSSVSRILVHEENRQALRDAKTEQEIFDIIASKI